MRRRAFVQGATAGLLAVSVASPAVAQANPKIRWRLVASWPKSLDTMYGSAVALCQRVQQLTDNNFEIAPFAAGEVVPAFQVMDAAQNGTVECGHTLAAFYTGKIPHTHSIPELHLVSTTVSKMLGSIMAAGWSSSATYSRKSI